MSDALKYVFTPSPNFVMSVISTSSENRSRFSQRKLFYYLFLFIVLIFLNLRATLKSSKNTNEKEVYKNIGYNRQKKTKIKVGL